MKLVIDTNVLIAAFTTHGLCSAVFEYCLERYDIIISEFIIYELNKILHKKFHFPKSKTEEVIKYLKDFCEIKYYKQLSEEISRDIDDDQILALALDNDVQYIITGDKDLLDLKKVELIEIVTPRQFWEKVQEKES